MSHHLVSLDRSLNRAIAIAQHVCCQCPTDHVPTSSYQDVPSDCMSTICFFGVFVEPWNVCCVCALYLATPAGSGATAAEACSAKGARCPNIFQNGLRTHPFPSAEIHLVHIQDAEKWIDPTLIPRFLGWSSIFKGQGYKQKDQSRGVPRRLENTKSLTQNQCESSYCGSCQWPHLFQSPPSHQRFLSNNASARARAIFRRDGFTGHPIQKNDTRAT